MNYSYHFLSGSELNPLSSFPDPPQYVHPSWGRRGIAAKILAVLEQEAISLGLLCLQVNASINAEAFYSKQGFEPIAHATYRLSSGQEMACVKMRKTLDAERPILENLI